MFLTGKIENSKPQRAGFKVVFKMIVINQEKFRSENIYQTNELSPGSLALNLDGIDLLMIL